jgi:FixJ family two-component response regulator
VVFVRKPFTPSTLARVIRSALDAHKAAAAGANAAD